MDNKQEFTINTTQDTVNIYQGKGLDQKADKGVSITGTISAPRRFLEGKKDKYLAEDAHLLANYDSGTLMLCLDAENPYCANTVLGGLSHSKDWNAIGLNNKEWTIEKLRIFLQTHPQYFSNQEQRREMVRKLFNFKAKFNTAVENMQDLKAGSRKLAIEKKVLGEVDIVKNFQVRVEVFQGEEPRLFNVEIMMQIVNDELLINLFSEDALIHVKDGSRLKIEDEMKAIEKIFPCSQVIVG